MSRSRRWCFTYNNYTPEDEQHVQGHPEAFKYLIYGREVAPETGTPHLQGFFVLQSARTLRGLKDFLQAMGWNRGVHLEQAKGSVQSNIDYCSKSDANPYECGIRPSQGARTDLYQVADSIAAGATIDDIAESFPVEFIKFGNGIRSLLATRCGSRTEKTRVIWCWGPTGSGKTRWCNDTYPEAYWKDGNTKWWDGYHGQPQVIIDDFRPSKEMPFNFLLRLFDRYALQVEVKGGYVGFTSSVICVTSPYTPEQLFTRMNWLEEEDLAQIYRRIDEVKEFTLIN